MNQNRFLYALLMFVFCSSIKVTAQTKHTFALGKQDFLLGNKPFQIISGELHPSRIPYPYWQHRIQMAKAMGCNTIALYVFWNAHEQQQGTFDFASKQNNIADFIRLCQKEGMWVLLRPGPYVCGEWDFGGLPPYLLKIPDIKVRCSDSRYMKAVQGYVKALAKHVKSLQVTAGGPILMLQVENEYGSFGNDKAYLNELQKMWIKNGINVPFYTADGPTSYMLEAGSLPNTAVGLDSGSEQKDFDIAKKHCPDVPVFSSETYPGWLTHWGEKWQHPDTTDLKKEVTFLLKNKKSVNFYVIHGGTNFGYTAGANAFTPTQFQPDVTSYDYDAPIDEQGNATPKFWMLRRLIQQYVDYTIPSPPAPIPVITPTAIQLQSFAKLSNCTAKTVHTVQPKPFEYFDQNQGMIGYKTTLIGHKSGKLKIWEPHDYALVFLDGKIIDTIYRDGGNWEVILPKTQAEHPVLEILVEGMGHINFAHFMIDRKGITDRVTLNGMTLMQWETTLYPMDEHFIKNAIVPTNNQDLRYDQYANFFKGNLQIDHVADTYLDMSAGSKGIVSVNGHLLGRYWAIGPQQRLYCPAHWLKQGTNEVIVFDFWKSAPFSITTSNTLY